MEVVEAEEKHVPDIVKIWKENMNYHKELDSYFTLRDDAHVTWETFLRERMQNCFVLVGLDGEKVVAYSIARVNDYPPLFEYEKHGFISDMCVTADYRRKGLGEQMLSRIFDWFESQSLERIELRVAHNNGMGQSFWKKHGFKDYICVLLLEK